VAKRSQGRSRNSLSLERARSGNAWVFVHPRMVRECTEDLDEVQEMIEAGETQIAAEELHWLLQMCPEMLPAHFFLGKIAVEVDNDLPLGRGHFGAGYQLGLQAWRRARKPTPLPALHPANRVFFDCGRGLSWCLHHLQKTPLAVEVVQQLRQLDASDPLGLTGWLDEMQTGNLPVVQLQGLLQPPEKPQE